MADHPHDSAEAAAAANAESAALERRRLMADFVVAGELERTRVAEAIHDDSIQVIAAMGMRLQMLRRAIADTAQLSILDEAERTVQLSIERLRYLVFELQPPGLDGEGVSVALAIALEAAAREGTVGYRLDDEMSEPPAPEEGAILFRIAQEALANVREHAQASTAIVTLLQRDGGHAVRIADDGRGCSPELIESGPAGYGFASMRARIGLAGGALSIVSVPGEGTIVEAWLPDLAPGGNGGEPT
jgi:signal transduction histidine kinase